jgi:hypothetical protein
LSGSEALVLFELVQHYNFSHTPENDYSTKLLFAKVVLRKANERSVRRAISLNRTMGMMQSAQTRLQLPIRLIPRLS